MTQKEIRSVIHRSGVRIVRWEEGAIILTSHHSTVGVVGITETILL